MSFAIRAKIDIGFIGDGQGGMQVPMSSFIRLEPAAGTNPVGLSLGSGDAAQWQAPIPGANTPTAANIQTALNSIVTDLVAQLNANGGALVTRIQQFATGLNA